MHVYIYNVVLRLLLAVCFGFVYGGDVWFYAALACDVSNKNEHSSPVEP